MASDCVDDSVVSDAVVSVSDWVSVGWAVESTVAGVRSIVGSDVVDSSPVPVEDVSVGELSLVVVLSVVSAVGC